MNDLCSESVTDVYIDEASFIKNLDEFYIALSNMVFSNDKKNLFIIASSITKEPNFFDTKFDDVDSNFRKFTLDWNVVPNRDQTWRDSIDASYGKEIASIEHDCKRI